MHTPPGRPQQLAGVGRPVALRPRLSLMLLQALAGLAGAAVIALALPAPVPAPEQAPPRPAGPLPSGGPAPPPRTGAVPPVTPTGARTGWSWPLAGPGQVTRPFALGASVYAAGHRGADLPGSAGQEVRSAGAGRVSYAGLLAGRGVVVVAHGALRTTYEPVTAQVRVGALVDRGARLGTLDTGHAGCPVAACLHWGLRRGEDYLDPVRLVRAGPVRLLPLPQAAPPPLPL